MFEQLFGAEFCTPNLHLNCHLHECIIDYGPPNSFWLFACERLNGIKGAVPTNHQNIEIQLMRKFVTNQQIFQLFSTRNDQVFQELFHSILKYKGSLQMTDLPELPLSKLSLDTLDYINCNSKLLPPIKQGCFTPDEVMEINKVLKLYFGHQYIKALMLYKHSTGLRLSGTVYGTASSIHSKSSLIYAQNNSGISTPGFVKRQ